MKRQMLLILSAICFTVSCSQNSKSALKIVGGKPASQYYPWFVQLVDSDASSEGFCGGTLIAPRIVLTAAHCMEPGYIRNLHVAMGISDGINLQLNHPVKVEGIVIHPKYSESRDKNDIALLYLADYSRVTFENPVKPIQISNDIAAPESIGASALVIGLGNATSVGEVFDGVIRDVELPLLSKQKCLVQYPDIDGSQICAGDYDHGGLDSCQGDSGGPMVSKRSDQSFVLTGIVSYGEGCAQKGRPGVYTRVAFYSKWIQESIVKLTKENSEGDGTPELTRLLQTKCVSQFGYLPIHQVEWSSHSRHTVYSMDLEQVKLFRSETTPVGRVLESCTFKRNNQDVTAQWIQPSENPAKVIVSITSQGDIWNSNPETLTYQQDSLQCSSSQGLITLADQRHVTYIQFRDVLYSLGDFAPEPSNTQTTWGCSVGDASVEVYEQDVGSTKELAARIHHRSIGTVSVKLLRVDSTVKVYAKLTSVIPGQGQLMIQNQSDQDIFTWKISCAKKFSMILADGRTLVAENHGSMYRVILESSLFNEGTIRSDQQRSVKLTWDGVAPSSCAINNAAVVETYITDLRL
jgi:Trypsin